MNHSPLVFAVILSMMAGPAAANANDLVIPDPTGDVSTRSFGPPVPFPAPAFDHLDVVSLWLANETKDAMELGVRLRRWDGPTGSAGPTQRNFDFMFTIGGLHYYATYPGTPPCKPTQAQIGASKTDWFSPFGCLDASVDTGKAEIKLSLAKRFLANGNYTPLQLGDTISNVHARTRSGGNGSDLVPDQWPGPSFKVEMGTGEKQGDLVLRADQPVRASNGEATTLLFRLQLRNEGTIERTALLSADNANPEWVVRAPPRIRVGAGKMVEFPVIVTMNFTHLHGVTQSFNLSAQDMADPAHASTTMLGVRWLDVPQPAGHHDRLWLHSRPSTNSVYGVRLSDLGFVEAWMNAVEADPRPDANDIDVTPAEGNPRATWVFPLEPKLEIGLDLDTARTGLFETTLRTKVPATRASLNASLIFCDLSKTLPGAANAPGCGGGNRVLLLTGVKDLGALGPNAQTSVSIPLRPLVDALPYRAGGNLVFVVLMNSDTDQSHPGTATDAVLAAKGSALQLPLHEYHDPVDQSFERIGSLALTPLDPHEKRLNPGKSSVFRFDITNNNAHAVDLRLGVEGINAGWATIREGPSIRVDANAKGMVTLVVRAPDDAVEGERAELFIVIEDPKDPSVVALGRVRAAIVPAEKADITDEAALGEPESNMRTPLHGAIVVLAFFAAAAMIRRGRTR